MSDLAKSGNEGWPIQAFQLPADAQTTSMPAATTTAALAGGMYLIQTTGVCTIALGLTCIAGMPLAAGTAIFFEVPPLGQVTIAGAGTATLTLMPAKSR